MDYSDTPAMWMELGHSWLVRLLYPLGLWLRDHGWASYLHRTWDYRQTSGEFWEMHGWQIGSLQIPFLPPQRNRVEEMTTPAVLRLWRSLEAHKKTNRW